MNKEVIEREYGCEAQEVSDREYPDWLCAVDFVRGEPDWKSLLFELDSAGMMDPPQDPPPPPWSACLDGSPWRLLVLGAESDTPLVEDRQACPPALTGERKAFEVVVESVIDRVLDRAAVQ